MQRSRDRFLTTHTGSLPRPDDLIRMMYAKEEGVPVEPHALAARVRDAVAEVVKKQADARVDLINDGEMSKPSYATYIKDRLGGFGGTGNTFVYQDLADFPRLEKRVFGDPGRSRRKTPACNAPITVRDKKAPQTDADNLKTALDRKSTRLRCRTCSTQSRKCTNSGLLCGATSRRAGSGCVGRKDRSSSLCRVRDPAQRICPTPPWCSFLQSGNCDPALTPLREIVRV